MIESPLATACETFSSTIGLAHHCRRRRLRGSPKSNKPLSRPSESRPVESVCGSWFEEPIGRFTEPNRSCVDRLPPLLATSTNPSLPARLHYFRLLTVCQESVCGASTLGYASFPPFRGGTRWRSDSHRHPRTHGLSQPPHPWSTSFLRYAERRPPSTKHERHHRIASLPFLRR